MPKQVSDEKLLETLLVCGSISKASKMLGITPSAIYKRLKNEEFRERYDKLHGIMLAVAVNTLSDSLNDAVNCLRDVIENPDAGIGMKISASDAILRHCSRYFDASINARRFETMQAQYKEIISQMEAQKELMENAV